MFDKIEANSTLGASSGVEGGIKKDTSINELSNLLTDGRLTMEKVEQEARGLDVDSGNLCLQIIKKLNLNDDFFNYCKEIGKEGGTNLSREEILHNFFEKIQQKPEPAKIEQESQIVDTPATSTATVSPVSIPEEVPRTTVVTPKEVEVQVLPVAPKKVEIPIVEPALVIKKVESIPKPERKNWQEVKRETEVMAVEDLSGSMEIFEKHMKTLGVARKDNSGHWQWTGDNKKLVFLGDILGDRGMDGMEITSIIGDLAKQAEKQGGQVNFLCGNHDMEFIRFLCNAGDDNYAEKNASLFTDQYRGILELARFDPDLSSELKKINPLTKEEVFIKHQKEFWSKLYKKMPEIMASLRNTKEGKKILENICRIGVAVVHDDTLFCHTDPTMTMVTELTKNEDIFKRVVEINKIFQNNLRKAIFKNKKLDNNFNRIEEIYLNTDNRENFAEQNSIIGLVENLIYKRLSSEVDRETLEKIVNSWKEGHGIVGEYANEVNEIIEAGKAKNKKHKKYKSKLEDELIEKIEELNPTERSILKIKNSGINAIIHGHSASSNMFYDENDLVIVSPHADFHKGSDIKKGTSIIQKNGRIDLIGKSFRE